jgi:hypothetical protein
MKGEIGSLCSEMTIAIIALATVFLLLKPLSSADGPPNIGIVSEVLVQSLGSSERAPGDPVRVGLVSTNMNGASDESVK